MLSEKIAVSNDGPVRIITINRPQVRNALDSEAARALTDAFGDFEEDETSKVAVLTGAGGSFCAGADLKEMAADGAVYEPWAGPNGPNGRALSKPTIAAITGHAWSIGSITALFRKCTGHRQVITIRRQPALRRSVGPNCAARPTQILYFSAIIRRFPRSRR